jgi:flagellar L-ring protein precursor FlgH
MVRTLASLPLLVPVLLVLAPAAGADSLWRRGLANGAGSPIADLKARGLGDTVTILVDERQQVEADESLATEKTTDMKASIDDFNVDPDAFDPLPSFAISSSNVFDGSADLRKEGTFVTRITAVVVDVQPNGNLVVEGRRLVGFDGEEKWMTVTGVIRPFDVSSSNTIRSEQVANATIRYESSGELKRAMDKGWFSKAVDFIWPF